MKNRLWNDKNLLDNITEYLCELTKQFMLLVNQTVWKKGLENTVVRNYEMLENAHF